jgi:hypothetical protein
MLLTGAQTEDGLVAELRHRAGLFDRMWRAQVGRLADGSTMDRAPESLANRLSFGGAGTRCAVSGGRYARANCTNVQIIAATVNNSSSASTIERGANMQEDRDRWLPLEHRWAARDFHGKLDDRVFAPPLPNDAFQRCTAVAEKPADTSS